MRYINLRLKMSDRPVNRGEFVMHLTDKRFRSTFGYLLGPSHCIARFIEKLAGILAAARTPSSQAADKSTFNQGGFINLESKGVTRPFFLTC